MTAPVTNGQWSFSIDSFYVETSGRNVHRRAPVSELQSLFKPGGAGSTSDPVGHWYEAQLMHYGLPPSKTKSVAKMRLLEAVMGGNLAVPKDIAKIEEDLKKEWKKKDKEARGTGGDKSKTTTTTTTMTTTSKTKTTTTTTTTKGGANNKRKRDGEDKVEPAAQRPAQTVKKSKPAEPTAKKPSTAKSEPKPKNAAAKEDVPMPIPKKQTAKRGGSTAGSRNTAPAPLPAPAPAPSTPNAELAQPGRRSKNTARRSNPFFGGRRPTDPAIKREYSTPQQPYGDPMDIDYPSDGHAHDDHSDEDPDVDPEPLPPLGLVNGEYEIFSDDLNEWPIMYPQEEFSLILGLAGNSMWGSYDFGMFHGIMHLQERPWSSSHRQIPFEFRGRDRSEGEMSFGPGCDGWIQFLGDGRIQGEIHCYGRGAFWGNRISGNETQPPRDVRSMREEWNGYNPQQYEYEREARWGGSSW